MGKDLMNVTISGAKGASGNIILPPPERHTSISILASSGLSPATEEVTAAYIRLLQRRGDERDNELAALRAEVAQMKQHMQQTAVPTTSRSGGSGRRRRQTPPYPIDSRLNGYCKLCVRDKLMMSLSAISRKLLDQVTFGHK
ncbi:hypothetical protein RHMOL_Rhmol06G0111900 [Rhododendron molle]|uniref:Uncharacterized protein n=1 Tax=Rhododendron molle TaxID=49168 RepID=A0ACC0NBX7_RHOML|nr:hypothetical protein RHMOL_Rhmol06G0111900 [Rhododendron molle]